ncbi:MAG: RnfABCDGE type electron transport complex subunit D [Oscillospiraceae bacterium]|nr:RnfABCDGE type electron transport complex subunit D [Oscillospiraceae bacterium]
MADNATRSPEKVYAERLVFLIAVVVLASFMQGVRAAVICAVSVAAAMLSDALCCALRKQRYDPKDFAVLFWGLCTGAMMPISAPVWAAVMSAAVCIIVGKHFFGSSDNIIFCPPAISTAFMIICYPAQMLYFPKFGESYPVFGEYDGILTRSAEYSLQLGYTPSANVWDTLLGFIAGPVGTVYGIVIIVCGICLGLRRKNSSAAMISCLVTVGILAFFFPRASYGAWNSVFYELSSGYLLFGAVFLCAEPYCIPKKTSARAVYGAVLGYITMMFRIYGRAEGGFLFALLIVSALSDSFDVLVENIDYWRKTYISSFEKNKTRVQSGEVKLTDTQEIVIPKKFRYQTPPINGTIKKQTRRYRKNRRDYNGKQ